MPATESPSPTSTLFERDDPRSSRDGDGSGKAVQLIDEKDGIGGFDRSSRPSGTHCDANIGRGEGGSVIDPIANHHDRPVLPLRKDDHNLLIRREIRSHGIE